VSLYRYLAALQYARTTHMDSPDTRLPTCNLLGSLTHTLCAISLAK
jgi:hypothetical protein